ncbi:MAG TPA: hypothetical protein H9912_05160, partial [Candidatus Eisenbergiella stercorigallinarum]|nr:hypothetical protein [Candidatus Eisenbergiella stercorigallinarum]
SNSTDAMNFKKPLDPGIIPEFILKENSGIRLQDASFVILCRHLRPPLNPKEKRFYLAVSEQKAVFKDQRVFPGTGASFLF